MRMAARLAQSYALCPSKETMVAWGSNSTAVRNNAEAVSAGPGLQCELERARGTVKKTLEECAPACEGVSGAKRRLW